jgi:ElaB/YqjD/DUF883 family membrane-anchored ribosome-binding protein
MVDRARSSAADQLNTQKTRATDGIGSVAQAIRQSTQHLRDQQHETIAGYVEQAADQLDKLSQQLREKDINEMLSDAQQFARRQPAMFVGAAFAVGLIGARFLKSSNDNREETEYTGKYESPYRRQSSSGRMSSSGSVGSRMTPRTSAAGALDDLSTSAAGTRSGAGTSTPTAGTEAAVGRGRKPQMERS